jgi:hypothetical protein
VEVKNSLLAAALWLTEQGFHVFPLVENTKIPHVKNFSKVAARDKGQIEKWWKQWPDANVGNLDF